MAHQSSTDRLKPRGVHEICLNSPKDKRMSAHNCIHVVDAGHLIGKCKIGGQCFLDGRLCDNGELISWGK